MIILVLVGLLLWTWSEKWTITLPTYTSVVHKEIMADKDNVATPVVQPKIEVHTENIKQHAPMPMVKENRITLATLLQQNKFYDALSYYLEHSTDKNRHMIESYLVALSQDNPHKALEYMPIYLDEVPQSIIEQTLVATYVKLQQYPEAIKLIMDIKEHDVSESEEIRLSKNLKEVALAYIDTLVEKKEYAQLIAFLEEMIAYDSSNSFYSFRLAQLYLELDKTQDASALLDELQYDEVYAQKVKSYIQEISLDESENKGYEYAIPLSKNGQHYIVTTVLDGTTFRLMLDTGASYIYIDDEKASMLEVIRTNLRLQTAGGDVDASLCKASTMQVGNLELHDIEVTTAPFKRAGIDGLLGMNFLNRFEFFINQEESVLYLNPK